MKWRKKGKRYFVRNTGEYNAVIFGAPLPHGIWAWAIWGCKSTDEGVEHSLASARLKANAVIERIERDAP
jgi:hypothetical protein